MERQNCKFPNQIIEENFVNMHLEIGIPISLIKQATIIGYPRYVYGDYEKPDILINSQNQSQNQYECSLCNRCFNQKKKLMKHINATNIKPLHNVPLNGCNNNDINDTYFLDWINKT